jgi:spore coat protein H
MATGILNRADREKNGKVTLDDLTHAATTVFAEFDKKTSGKMDVSQFSDMLTALFPFPQFGGGPPAKK